MYCSARTMSGLIRSRVSAVVAGNPLASMAAKFASPR